MDFAPMREESIGGKEIYHSSELYFMAYWDGPLIASNCSSNCVVDVAPIYSLWMTAITVVDQRPMSAPILIGGWFLARTLALLDKLCGERRRRNWWAWRRSSRVGMQTPLPYLQLGFENYWVSRVVNGICANYLRCHRWNIP